MTLLNAFNVVYDNSTSGLTSQNVQGAIDNIVSGGSELWTDTGTEVKLKTSRDINLQTGGLKSTLQTTPVELSHMIFGNTIYGGEIATNLDTLSKSGFYTCYGVATGAPSASYSWFILHQNSNSGIVSASQKAVAFSESLIIYERIKTSSTWGDWKCKTQAIGTEVVASRTLLLTDASLILDANSTDPIVITVPTNDDVAFPVGTVIYIMRQNIGSVSVVGDTDVNILSESNNTLIGAQYAGVVLRKQATNTWNLVGNLTA